MNLDNTHTKKNGTEKKKNCLWSTDATDALYPHLYEVIFYKKLSKLFSKKSNPETNSY